MKGSDRTKTLISQTINHTLTHFNRNYYEKFKALNKYEQRKGVSNKSFINNNCSKVRCARKNLMFNNFNKSFINNNCSKVRCARQNLMFNNFKHDRKIEKEGYRKSRLRSLCPCSRVRLLILCLVFSCSVGFFLYL